jgi:hypothetical protein
MLLSCQALPLCATPTIPPAAILAQQIIKSSNKLYFISNSIGAADVREWQLVRVGLEATMESYSSCLVTIDIWSTFTSPIPQIISTMG